MADEHHATHLTLTSHLAGVRVETAGFLAPAGAPARDELARPTGRGLA